MSVVPEGVRRGTRRRLDDAGGVGDTVSERDGTERWTLTAVKKAVSP